MKNPLIQSPSPRTYPRRIFVAHLRRRKRGLDSAIRVVKHLPFINGVTPEALLSGIHKSNLYRRWLAQKI